MSEENRDILISQFMDWALKQKSPDYEISYFKDKYDHVLVDTEYGQGLVAFYPLDNFNVAEMSVINKITSEATFYLHFELKDLEHAKELFAEMVQAVLKLKTASIKKILLCCSSAITTSFFKEKLISANELLSLDYEFDAVSYNRLFVKGYDADVILLAPQISYDYNKVREIMKDKIVLVIPTQVFAAYDIAGLIEFISEGIKDEEKKKKERMLPAERMEFKNTPELLIISVIVESETMRFVYRIYNGGQILHQDIVIKQKFEIRDLEDMLDIEFARFPEIELVCVNSPGVFSHGRMTFRTAGIYDEDVEKRFNERYNRRIFFMNDANAMALGFYGLQKKTENLSFYFHPHAARTAGVGNVINGKLHTGNNSLAGEMQYIHRIVNYSDNPDVLLETPEGTLEIVAKYLISIIANYDPEQIIIFCDMVYDLDELKREIAKVVQEAFIPELIKVDDCIEYMFVGGMMMCVDELHKNKKESSHD